MRSRLPSHVETDRLVLRHWQVEDSAAVAAAVTRSLEHLRPWMPWIAEEPLTFERRRELVAEWKEKWEQGNDSFLGIFRDDEVVGGTGLHRRVGPNAVEIGYWIHVDHAGIGYATEATGALTGAAFEVPDIEAVEIHHDEANLASRRVPEKLGYIIKETGPKEPEAPGETGVEVQWVMTREAWASRRS